MSPRRSTDPDERAASLRIVRDAGTDELSESDLERLKILAKSIRSEDIESIRWFLRQLDFIRAQSRIVRALILWALAALSAAGITKIPDLVDLLKK